MDKKERSTCPQPNCYKSEWVGIVQNELAKMIRLNSWNLLFYASCRCDLISSRSQLALKSSLLFPPCVHLMASLNLSSMTWSQLLLHSTSGQGSSTSTEIKMNPNIYIYIYNWEKCKEIRYRIKKKKGTYH